jgi:hypothetical protein
MTIERNGNRIKFIETDNIPYEVWLKILARINYLGYGMPSVDSLREYFNRHTFLNKDQSIEVLKVFGEPHNEVSISEEDIEKYIQKAKDKFGTTTRLSLAGYILTDGTLLKMAYDNWIRDIDHREIRDVLDVDTSDDASAAMIQFINMGNVRLQERSFEISKPLTVKQKPVIADLIRKCQRSDYTYMCVDISNYEGRVIKTFEYDFPSVSNVFTDIDAYFESIKL